MQDYRVQLDVYQGPLDLLLFLIRRDEVDIYDIPIARVTRQFVEYVDLLRAIDPNVVGDFLVMAATLMEIKSRMLLPRPPADEDGDEAIDPRADLVRQLLEYKRFKDAAGWLSQAAQLRASQFDRPGMTPPGESDQIEIEDVQIWDLIAAFNKVMSSIGRPPAAHEVLYDDTPISLHATDVQDRLDREGGSLQFELVFEGRTKGEMIGLFLALLELIRQKRVRIEQEEPFAPIIVHLVDRTPITEASILAAESMAADEPEDADADDTETDTESDADASDEAAAEAAGAFVAMSDDDEPDDDADEYSRMLDAVRTDIDVHDDLPGTIDDSDPPPDAPPQEETS